MIFYRVAGLESAYQNHVRTMTEFICGAVGSQDDIKIETGVHINIGIAIYDILKLYASGK